MFASVAQPVRRTVGGQFLIGKKFENSSGERLAVPWLDEQSILPGLDNFGNVAHFRCYNRAAAGKSFPKNDWRRFSTQRCDRHHVASGENIGCVPAISYHEDFGRQSRAGDRASDFLAEL